MTQLKYKDTIIAEANTEDIIHIEGNYYFPPQSINKEMFSNGDMQYTCPWKGEAQYHNVKIQDEMLENSAWSYPIPKEGSVERVGKDFSNYVAFDLSKGFEIVEGQQ